MCIRDRKKDIDKAKAAIRKGNEEGAKLFLANAVQKQKESLNMLKMAHKMDALSSQVKSNTHNTELMQNLNSLTPLLNFQADNISVENVYTQMSSFQEAMDKLTVAGQLVDTAVNKNITDENSDVAVDTMFNQLKQEMYVQVEGELGIKNDNLFNELKQPAQKSTNKDEEFLNNLKKL
eukprot:TRINITY_DN711_c0_g1_i4.p1 TRINITY_DN711_c0_g1~~TRINITY_DN711_c0_g1_i4.p1  ORF type:complete len:178 (+),score=29.28 TRINITY_DN711_c0_g1_i4:72-605(+)